MSGGNNMADSEASIKAKKRAKRERAMNHKWIFEQETFLIEHVEKRPPLWNCTHQDYKCANIKSDLWGEVVKELNIDTIKIEEAKIKWNNLRSNFKAFLNKQRTKKSGQGAIDGTATAKYPHYSELMFLESADVQQSSQSISTLELDNPMTDQTFLNDLGQAAATQATDDNRDAPPRTPTNIFQHRKRATSKTSVMPSPTPSRSAMIKDSALNLLNKLEDRSETIIRKDHFCVFGDLIAGRLRMLRPEQAEQMEMEITQTMYSCLQSFRASDSQSFVIVDVDSNIPESSTSPAALSPSTVSRVIRPKPSRSLGLPLPPRNVEKLPLEPKIESAKTVQMRTETIFLDGTWTDLDDMEVEELIEESPPPK
ncbi:uncharacterized protein LOC129941983 [Eupeodes corollae]|uniref:uncharacterized protein LOC129941983 n=1 Tax=Eupeodes corollae TaxID=290404 RepID=UPI002490A688|nr:uncharacterized protein LOC129941983 [Eupeodes corollae]